MYEELKKEGSPSDIRERRKMEWAIKELDREVPSIIRTRKGGSSTIGEAIEVQEEAGTARNQEYS